MQHVPLLVWLISLSIRSFGYKHVVTYSGISFLFKAELSAIVWMGLIFFIRLTSLEDQGLPETSHWQTPASGSRCCCELMSETVMNGFCQGNVVLEAQSSLLFLAVCALAQRSGDWTPQATKSQCYTSSTRLCQWPFASHCLCQHLPTAQLSRRLC